MATSIKEIFEAAEGGMLTYEQFQEAAKDAKFVDLNTGEYVSKKKYEDELSSKDGVIEKLNSTISSRNKDLESLKTQLSEAGADSEKLEGLTKEISDLQGRYDTEVKNYKAQLKQQAYEFAVKDFANSKEFSSAAAKRDFISTMIAQELKMDGDAILGAEDFVTKYQTDNADAFVQVQQAQAEPEPSTPAESQEPTKVPMFVASTQGADTNSGGNDNPFINAFHFTNFVRPPENNN